MNRYAIVVGCVVLGLALSGPGAGLGPPAPPADHSGAYGSSDLTYAVQQGDRCLEVAPLGDGGTTVDSFYRYRNSRTSAWANSHTSYSAYGANRLQANQVSSVFLYDGADGVSLVFLHDERGVDSPDDAAYGGAATFDIRGLPDGEWAVRDDFYDDGAQADRWRSFGSPGGGYQVDWVWRDGRTDGGAYRGIERLGAGDAVRITPAFDERAGLWDDDLDNATDVMRRWQLVGGGGRHVDLSMREPITISRGPCSDVSVERRGLMGIRLEANGDGPVRNATRYLPPTAPGDATGVQLSRAGLQLRDGAPPFALDATLHTSRPTAVPPVEGVTADLLYVTMDQRGLGDGAVDGLAVQFDVSRQLYEDRDLQPDRVVVLQHRNGTWRELPTAPAFETADAYVFEATAPAVAPLVVATREPDVRINVTPVDRTVARGEAAVVNARIENRGRAADAVPVEFTVRGQVVERRNVTVPAGAVRTVEFAHELDRTGVWELGVNGRTVDVEVEPPSARLAVVELGADPSTVGAGEQVEVTATVRNVGDAAGTERVSLSAFGTTVATKEVTLSPGETGEVTFVRTIEAPGNYTLGVGDEQVQVTVTGDDGPATTARPSETGSPADVLGAGMPAIVLGVVFLLISLVGAVLLWR